MKRSNRFDFNILRAPVATTEYFLFILVDEEERHFVQIRYHKTKNDGLNANKNAETKATTEKIVTQFDYNFIQFGFQHFGEWPCTKASHDICYRPVNHIKRSEWKKWNKTNENVYCRWFSPSLFVSSASLTTAVDNLIVIFIRSNKKVTFLPLHIPTIQLFFNKWLLSLSVHWLSSARKHICPNIFISLPIMIIFASILQVLTTCY